MCGICGMLRSDRESEADFDLVAKMNAALVHRGPDDHGLFTHGPCALAARRLSVIDIEAGHQPMRSPDGRYALVYNGEIYNAPQLRDELARLGCTFRTRSDTEVLLQALIQWDEDALARLNGMFAFAFYDTTENRLLLARDRLGIKPLFVLNHSGDIYFASELDPLIRSGRVSGKLDPASLDAYFTYLYIPGPATVFADIAQLEPAELRIYHRGAMISRRYWAPSYSPDPAWTLERASERYTHLLSDSVSMQRVSDVPLGAFLSGGIDSASVVATLAQMQSQPVSTFTVGFQEVSADERVFADAVAQRFNTNHISEVMEPDFTEILPRIISHFGQPFADSSAVPTWLVSRLARENVTVALSGDGGDELFAGYSWLHMTRRVNNWRAFPEPLRRLLDVVSAIGNISPGIERIHRFNRDSFLSTREVFRRRQTCFYADERAALYEPRLRNAVAAVARDRFAEFWDSAAASSDDDRMLHQDLGMYLPDDVLTKVDRMSMAASLEMRVPLLDHRSVEFAGTLPFDLKWRNGVSKRVPKNAFAGVLPASVLKQRKRGFAIPVDHWLRTRLRSYVEDTIMGPDSHLRNWLAPREVARFWDMHLSGKRNFGHRLWALLVFELWLRYVAEHLQPTVD